VLAAHCAGSSSATDPRVYSDVELAHLLGRGTCTSQEGTQHEAWPGLTFALIAPCSAAFITGFFPQGVEPYLSVWEVEPGERKRGQMALIRCHALLIGEIVLLVTSSNIGYSKDMKQAKRLLRCLSRLFTDLLRQPREKHL
jgi:hypothetical protein